MRKGLALVTFLLCHCRDQEAWIGLTNTIYGYSWVDCDPLDFSKFACYPRSGTTCTDLKESLTGTVNNGASFSTDNLGVFDFDGVDDQIDCGKPAILETYPLSFGIWFYADSTNTKNDGIITKGTTRGSASQRGFDVFGNGTDLIFVVSNGSSYPTIH